MTATIFDVFATDQSAEKDGRWFPLPGLKGAAIRLRRAGGQNALWAVTARDVYAAAREAAGVQSNADLPDAAVATAEARVAARALVADWRGVPGQDGAEIAFSAEEAERLFAAMPDFLLWVQARCGQMAEFQNAAIARDKAALGNG